MFDALKKLGDVAGGLLFKEPEAVQPTNPPGKPVSVGGFATFNTTKGGSSTFESGAVVSTQPLNTEMIDELKKVVTKRVSAFTTLEEKSNVMATAIPDETMRTRAAFGILSAEGRSAADIIKAIEMHILDIDSEQVRFTNACTGAKQTKSSIILSDIAKLEKAVVTDNELVDRLQQQITDTENRLVINSTAISEKTLAVQQVDNDINAKITAFGAAAVAVKDSLNTRKTVLSSILV